MRGYAMRGEGQQGKETDWLEHKALTTYQRLIFRTMLH